MEWATLLFFAGLFVIMQGMTELGLIDYIGRQTSKAVLSVEPSHRVRATAGAGEAPVAHAKPRPPLDRPAAQLAAAIVLILWVCAIASAFIDNIPLTAAMVPVIVQLGCAAMHARRASSVRLRRRP